MSWFSEVKTALPPESFVTQINYYNDSSKNKILLGVGGYRTDEGVPFVLPVVKKADLAIANNENLSKDYVQFAEDRVFQKAATELLLGKDSPAIKENRVYGVPCVAGAGAFRLGAEFLVRILGLSIFYYSCPTWGNHKVIFKNAGFTEGREYRYWSDKNKDLDFEGLIEDLNNAPQNSVVILQTCAHNPTGVDPTEEQWRQIAQVIKTRKLFPFFDNAFQGLASGNPDKDAFAVRLFVDMGLEFFCAHGFSKTFGIYSERCGSLVIVVNDSNLLIAFEGPFFSIESKVMPLYRATYIRPPMHGFRIVSHILNDPDLKAEWKQTISEMVTRLTEIRKQLQEKLEALGTPGDWSHISRQVGFSCCLGLNENQVKYLAEKYHIHMPIKGYFSVSALNPTNIELISTAIHESVTVQ